MLEKEEYHEAYYKGKKFILCDRVDMTEDIEKELLQGTTFAYKCEADRKCIVRWKKMFEDLNNATFIFGTTFTGRRFVKHRDILKCIHRERAIDKRKYRTSRNPSKDMIPERGTSKCPAIVVAVIRRNDSPRYQKPTNGYAFHVYSNCMSHNHPREAALKCRPVSNSTKTALLKLFDQGHAPTSALQVLKQRLLETHGDGNPSILLDRSVLPDLDYVNRIYYQTYRLRYGELSRKEVRRLRQTKLEQSQTAVATDLLLKEQGRNIPNVEDRIDTVVGKGCEDPHVVMPGKLTPMCDSTKAKLLELFDQGHMPATALQVLKQRLLKEYGDSSPSVLADRSVLPVIGSAASLYYQTYRSRYGNLSRKEVRRLRKMRLEQSETAVAASAVLTEQGHSMTDVEEYVIVNSFPGSEELPADWYADSDEALTTDTSWEGTSALGTENAYAATSGVDDPLAVAYTPAADGPSIAETASHIRRWAACVSREVALDASGQWQNAAAAFIQQWERLPATSKLKGLQGCKLGRAPKRACSAKGDNKRASGVCGTAIDSGDYRSVTDTGVGSTGTGSDVFMTGTESGICGTDTDQTPPGRKSRKGKRQNGTSSRRSVTALCVLERPLDVALQ